MDKGFKMIKRCSKCLIKQDCSSFYKNKSSKDGYAHYCKKCEKELHSSDIYKQKKRTSHKKWRDNNKEKIRVSREKYESNNKDKIKEKNAKYFKNNKEKIYKYIKEYQNLNKERILEYRRKWHNKNKERINKEKRENIKIKENNHNKYINDIYFNLNSKISNYIRLSLKGNKNNQHWENIVGYTTNELKNNLEKYFKEGMNWDKFLNGEIHIEHVLPKELFEYKSYNDPLFKICWSLDNLRPEWSQLNISKQDKLPDGRLARNLSKEEKLEYIRQLGFSI